jgi:hypothetical protein
MVDSWRCPFFFFLGLRGWGLDRIIRGLCLRLLLHGGLARSDIASTLLWPATGPMDLLKSVLLPETPRLLGEFMEIWWFPLVLGVFESLPGFIPAVIDTL